MKNPIIVALRSEINQLAQQLETARQNLSAATAKFRVIIDAVQQGLVKIEKASFNTNLRDLIETRRVSMSVTLLIGAERRTLTAAWNFDGLIRDNLKPAIDQILRERGII